MKQTTLIVLAITLLASCSCDPIIVKPVPLPKPAKPTLLEIPPQDVACLTPEAYQNLAIREQQIINYAQECIAIIESTNKPTE